MAAIWTRRREEGQEDERTATPWNELLGVADVVAASRTAVSSPKVDEVANHYPHYHVVCAVVENEGAVLCMQKGKTKYEYTAFHWEFPGGKVEEGETPEEALHRELMEEMEYDVRVGEHLLTVEHSYPDFSLTMEAFRCEADTRTFRMKEHSASLWVEPSHLEELPWCEADKPIARQMALYGKRNTDEE